MSAAGQAAVGVGVASTSIGSGPLIQYVAAALHWPAMSEPQAAGAMIVVAVVLHGVVSLVGPVAKALSDRFVNWVQPKEVPNA